MTHLSHKNQSDREQSSQDLSASAIQSTQPGRVVADLEAVKTFMRETLYGADGMRVYHKAREVGAYSAHEYDRQVDIASCTKSIAAIAIFKAVELRLLALDDTISGHLPDFTHLQRAPHNQITIRHLLTHTSGYPGNDFFVPKTRSRGRSATISSFQD